MPPFPFYTPWKFQTLSFLMFSRIQKDNSGMEWVKNKFYNAEADDVLTNQQLQNSWRKTWILTHLFPMQPFSSPGKHKVFWCFQGVEKGSIRSKQINKISRVIYLILRYFRKWCCDNRHWYSTFFQHILVAWYRVHCWSHEARAAVSYEDVYSETQNLP